MTKKIKSLEKQGFGRENSKFPQFPSGFGIGRFARKTLYVLGFLRLIVSLQAILTLKVRMTFLNFGRNYCLLSAYSEAYDHQAARKNLERALTQL